MRRIKGLGGICLHVGCIPTKALITSSDYVNELKDLDMMGIHVESFKVDIQKMVAWKDGIVNKLESGIRSLCQKNQIEVIEGYATFTGPNTVNISGKTDINTVKFKDAIIATGSSTIEIPGFKFDGQYIISSDHAMDLKEIPNIVTGKQIGRAHV